MNWIKNKSFFNKVLGYFFIILVVPVCTLLLLYYQTEQTTKNQIEASSYNTLNQFFQAVDIVLDEMTNTAMLVSMDEECERYARYSVLNPKKMTYQAYKTKKSLKALKQMHFQDVFAYFPYSDRIVSAENSSVSSDLYFQAYFDRKNDIQRTQFDEILGCTSRKAKLYGLVDNQNTVRLCVAMYYENLSDNRRSFVSVVVLSPEYLKELLENSEVYLEGAFYVFGEDKQLLYTNGAVNISSLREETAGQAPYEEIVDGKKYIVQTVASEALPGYYAYAIPEHYYWEQLEITRGVYILGILACALISFYISYRLCKRAYAPIDQMLGKLQEQSLSIYDKRRNSEFEFIENLFASESKKNISIMKEGQNAIQERFLVQLLSGNVPKQSKENIFEEHDMSLCSDRFCVALFLSEKPEYDELDDFVFKNVFGELFNEKHKGYIVILSENRYCILINLAGDSELEEVVMLLKQGKDFLQEKLDTVITVGVSGIQEGMTWIPNGYKQANEALRYRYIYRKGCLVEYVQIKNRKIQYQSSSESRLYLMLSDFISTDARQATSKYVASLFELYGIHHQAAITTVDSFLVELVGVINRILLSREYPADERMAYVEKLTQAATLDEMKMETEKMLSAIRSREQGMKKSHDLCQKAREYIRSNYADSDLSVTSLGTQFGITSSYLSRLYKEAFDISLMDDIALTRIQASKELLKKTDYSVAEIAIKCGFLRGNVFINAFKKWEGITPGAYRKLQDGTSYPDE